MEDEYQYSVGTDKDAEDVLSWDVDPRWEAAGTDQSECPAQTKHE